MVNQSLLNSDKRVVVGIADTVDSGVSLVVRNMANTIVESGATASYDAVNEQYYYDVASTIFSTSETYTVIWTYKTEDNDKSVETKMDILDDSKLRYCYQEDIRRKLFDILLPSTFDLGMYSLRATNEVDRALQGLYALPLTPDSSHTNYAIDMTSIMELASDIATGYAIEDIKISVGTEKYNQKKTAAFAELNRYVDLKKSLSSVPKDTVKDDLHYQHTKPRVAASEYQDGSGDQMDDPFNSVYNQFSPRSDRV